MPRERFHELLREWLRRGDRDATVGDIGNFGGRGWLFVLHGGERFRLHADAHEFGVGEYLARLDVEPDLGWHVVNNARGRANKVAFGARCDVIAGFYLYLEDVP
jgi:hypothetical protein